MLLSYVRVALRNLRRQPGYAFINVLGLSIGLACCLLIAAHLRKELGYDRFHENADRIYRVHSEFTGRGQSTFTDGVLAADMAANMPEVAAAARLTRTEHLLTVGDRSGYGTRIAFTDPDFFEIFSYRLLQGDPDTALEEPNSIVLTESTARLWFSEEDPMGRSILVDNETEYRVTGILADIPETSHYTFEALSSIETIKPEFPWYDQRGSISLQTYILIARNASIESLRERMPDYARANYDAGDGQAWLTPRFFPMTDIHLRSSFFEVDAQGSIESIYVFATIAGFILLLACINYMNLATARAGRRAREIGVRKVSGASPRQLVSQFMAESVLITAMALGIGLGLAWLATPVLSGVTSVSLSAPLAGASIGTVGLLIAGAFGVGILAGSYPAFYLTRFRPVLVLKGSHDTGSRGSFLRKTLVVVQFSVSVALLASTLVVREQLDFMRSKSLGFESENVVNVPLRDPAVLDRVAALQDALDAQPGVLNSTVSTTGVSEFSSSAPVRRADMESDVLADPNVGFVFADARFIETFGMTLVAGRNFRPEDFGQDNSVILTEEAVRQLGWETPEAALDELITTSGGTGESRIVGVVADFHVRALTNNIVPIMLFNDRRIGENLLSIRLAAGDGQQTLAKIAESWRQALPEWPFEYRFLEEELEARSFTVAQTGRLFGLFSGLAIFIGCLGLFGLAAYMAERRTREVGVRKVLGASAAQIVVLLSREFALLVVAAIVLATPVVLKGMDSWLSSYAFRIDLPWQVLLIAGTAAMALALVTVGGQALRAANLDPVETLRAE